MYVHKGMKKRERGREREREREREKERERESISTKDTKRRESFTYFGFELSMDGCPNVLYP